MPFLSTCIQERRSSPWLVRAVLRPRRHANRAVHLVLQSLTPIHQPRRPCFRPQTTSHPHLHQTTFPTILLAGVVRVDFQVVGGRIGEGKLLVFFSGAGAGGAAGGVSRHARSDVRGGKQQNRRLYL